MGHEPIRSLELRGITKRFPGILACDRIDLSVGEHSVRARAYDAAGEVQPEEPKAVAPDGAQGYHRVTFTVT